MEIDCNLRTPGVERNLQLKTNLIYRGVLCCVFVQQWECNDSLGFAVLGVGGRCGYRWTCHLKGDLYIVSTTEKLPLDEGEIF